MGQWMAAAEVDRLAYEMAIALKIFDVLLLIEALEITIASDKFSSGEVLDFQRLHARLRFVVDAHRYGGNNQEPS